MVRPLKLSGESFAVLSGRWQGTIKVKQQGVEVSLPLAMQFATDDRAQMIGFIDSPGQGVNKLYITEASLEGGKFVAKLAAINAEFRGDLTGKTLKGEWIQGPQRVPLTLTKQ